MQNAQQQAQPASAVSVGLLNQAAADGATRNSLVFMTPIADIES